MKSKLNRSFNAAAAQYSNHRSNDVEVIVDDNFNIVSDNFSLKDRKEIDVYSDFDTTDYKITSNANYLINKRLPIESDLLNVNQTIKLINDNQLLKCLKGTMLNNETLSSSPLDDQLSQTSNGSSANAETNKSSEQLELVSISSPGDTGLNHYTQQTNFYGDHSDSADNSNGEWSNLNNYQHQQKQSFNQDLDYEQHPKKRKIQTRQSTALANQLNSQLTDHNNQINQLQQLVLAQQQLNALRGQQQQQTTSLLLNQLLNQLTKETSDPDIMSSNAVALSNLLNGSMNITQLNQHLNQLNQLSQLGLNNSSLASLIHKLSNQTSSAQSNQNNSAFNLPINRNSNSPNVLNSNQSSTLPFLNVQTSSSTSVGTSNQQPTNSTVTSQSLDSNKKPFELCLVCGDKASG